MATCVALPPAVAISVAGSKGGSSNAAAAAATRGAGSSPVVV